MKRSIYYIFLVMLMVLPTFVFSEAKLIENATAGLLMEQSTGNIIFEKEKDKKVAVASMTKMVAQTIILEYIEKGKIKWTDVVQVSKNAADMGGSQIYLSPFEKMTVKDLFKGISMASANDAVVAMAEYISGSEEKFVELMNKKVKEYGLKNTTFKNSTGLDEEGHLSTAYDMAVIARNLIRHEQIFDYSSLYEDYLRQDTENKFWLVNTNKLVRYYEGADGLKTGHTDAAKYCIAATAKKNGMRLIAIVLGEDNSKTRNSEAMQLLDYGFNTKKIVMLKHKKDPITEIKVEKSDKDKIKIYPIDDVTALEDKDSSTKKYTYSIDVSDINLPLKKGQVVGNVKVYDNKKMISTNNLIVNDDLSKLSFIKLYIKEYKNIATGNM